MDELLSELLEFEERENLFERKYRGVNYWQYIRVNLMRTVRFKGVAGFSTGVKKENSAWKKTITLLKGSLSDIISGVLLKHRELLYFDQQLYRYVDGSIVDSYFDFFGFQDKYSIQRCYYYANRKSREDFGDYYVGVSIADLFQGGLYKLSRLFPSMLADEQEDRFIADLCERISSRFEVTLSADVLINNVKDAFIHHNVYAKYYSWLIKKVKPKAIIVAEHYIEKLFPLYGVAHKEKIPVIELEHGIICGHDAYCYGDLSEKGKELPDFVFTYGDFLDDYIKLPVCMKAIAVGNPFLESRKDKYVNIKPDEKSVVFYSEGILERGREQAQFAVDFYERNAGKGYKVYFKLHPIEYESWEENYPILKNHPEINIIPKGKDLYEILASAKHHVSMSSTVLYEAVVFGVRRYVMIKPKLLHILSPLIDMGLAKGFYSIDEFENLLDENVSMSDYVVGTVWKENAKENGLFYIQKIIDDYEKEREVC